MSKSIAALRLVDAAPSVPSNIVRFPRAGAREPAEREIVRLTVRREVTTLELERLVER